jgi:hypothetical protein
MNAVPSLLPPLLLIAISCAACEFEGSTRSGISGDSDGALSGDARVGVVGDGSPGGDASALGDAAALGPDAAPAIEIRLNIAGPEHVGSDYPGGWKSDPGLGGACGPFYYSVGSPVGGTTDDPLFFNVAYGDPMVCSLGDGQLPGGNYRVRLYFAEIYFGPGCIGGGGTGNRVFDIELENTLVQSNLDPSSLVGCSQNGGTPYVASFELAISDGTLNIDMPASADNGMVSAIELVSLF